jgi:hypothetical protein
MAGEEAEAQEAGEAIEGRADEVAVISNDLAHT